MHCTFRHTIGLFCPELGGAAVDTDEGHEQKCRGKWGKMFSRMSCNGIFVNISGIQSFVGDMKEILASESH